MTDVHIAIPVYNEAAALESSIRRLHEYLSVRFPFSWAVTIADNASTDGTWPIAARLAASLTGVEAVHLGMKGRGRALRAVWGASEASVVAYMDVDLSTDLDALVAEGKVHYFIPGGGMGGGRGGTASTSGAITSWVDSTFTARTVGGITLYDFTAPVA